MNLDSNQKVAVCVLSRGYFFKRNYKQLINRNNSIIERIAKKNNTQFDILIFHEGNISDSDKNYINKKSPDCIINYISLKQFFNKKHTIKKSSICWETPSSKKFGFGYKCMCQFWFSEFLKYTTEYKYVIRIDEDCEVIEFPLDFLIDELRNGAAKYVTPRIYGFDSTEVTVGMRELCLEYVEEREMKRPAAFDQNPYTNVFLMDADYFRGNEVFISFTRKVNECGCIYINRWGDLPLWGCILSMMGDKILAVNNNIKYFHGSHSETVN